MTEKVKLKTFTNEEGVKGSETEEAKNQRFYDLPEGWKWVRLDEITWINREKRDPTIEIPNKEFIYIDISSVEEETGWILEVKKVLGKNAPSRARRVVHANDIIMSTVRPYLKSFAIIPGEYEDQICSTGFAVLSCREKIIPKYLLYALFSSMVIHQCNEMMIGAHYPALRIEQVARIKIPLPPLEEQRRIVSRLEELVSRAEEAKRLRRIAREKVEKIMQSAFNKVFSRAEEERWKWVRLRDLVETMNGLVVKQDPNNREGYPISRIETIQNWKIDSNRVRFVNISKELFGKFMYSNGDILFSHINSFELVGKVAIYEGEPKNLMHGMNLLRIRLKDKNNCDPYFLFLFFRTKIFREQLEPYIKRAVNQCSVNQTNLKSLKVPLPPIEEQRRIVKYLGKIEETTESLRKLQHNTEGALEKLVPTIQDKAFKGEL